MGSRNNKPGRIVKGTAPQPSLKSASGVWSLDEAMQAHRANAWPQPNLFQPVSNSLRLKNANNSALVRQPGRPGNQRTWTWSAWLKMGIVSGTREFFNGSPSGSAFSGIRMIDGQIYIQDYSSGSYNIWWVSTALYRDTSAWYHIVVKYDTTQTQGNAAILYVNGVQQTLTFGGATGAYVQNRASWINASNTQRFGQNIGGDYYDGQIGEVNFVDGYALQPTLFGQLDTNNTWVPVAYTGSYGTNGFYLPFTNAASSQTLGYDASLNGTTTYDADQDPYRGSVALHLTGNGPAGGNNNVFADSGPNNYAVTRNGDTTQGSFSPFPFNTNTPYNPATHGASAYFNGTSDWLATPQNANFTFDANFTIEFWVYISTNQNADLVATATNAVYLGSGNSGWVIAYYTSGGIRFGYQASSSWVVDNALGMTPALNAWNHIAVVRSGSTITGYLNGVAGTPLTSSATFTSNLHGVHVGAGAGNSYQKLGGYVSGLRIIKGAAIYTAAFTPTMRPFGTLTNNLIAFSEDFSNASWTIDGTGATSAFNASVAPDGTPSATLAREGTSAAGGARIILTSPWSTLSATTFTFSMYVKKYGQKRNIFMLAQESANAFYAHFDIVAGTVVNASNSGTGTYTGSGITDVGNGWFRIWITGSITSSAIYTMVTGEAVGSTGFSAGAYTGDGSSGYLVWGAQLETASSPSNYTPTPANFSTAPSLLLNFANAAVTDTAGGDNILTGSGATITSASKYGSGAMIFNGSSDYLTMSSTPFTFTGNFTIELWGRTTSNQAVGGVFSTFFETSAYNGTGLGIKVVGGGSAACVWYNGSQILTGTSSIIDGTWHHIAVTRVGATMNLFVGGQLQSQYSSAATFTPGTVVVGGSSYNSFVGGWLLGQVDDLRVTTGVARYTSAFTPPARALPETGGKSFVTTNVNAGVVQRFTTVGTTAWTAPVDVTSVEVLVVAAGGTGASDGATNVGNGGGGGGGLIYSNAHPVTPGQTYTVTVGAGQVGLSTGQNRSGGNSQFGNLIAIGGGGGGYYSNGAGSTGGSGGGGGAASGAAGAGTSGQGFAGGAGASNNGGGGGGAGGPASGTNSRDGGLGLQFGISGTPTFYAGGGGGSASSGAQGTGGSGSGGAAVSGGAGGVDGTANTGGGGGAQLASGTKGGNGGSGVVIVRYTTTAVGNTSDATSDNLVDSPTLYGHDTGAGGEVVGNYATWNPLLGANNQAGGGSTFASSVVVLSNGNLNASNPTAAGQAPRMQVHSNIGMPSGKWYAEFTGLSGRGPGISLGDYIPTSGSGSGISHAITISPSGAVNVSNGASATITGTAVAISATDVVGVAFDADNRVCYYYRNGVLTQTASNITTTLGPPYFASNSWFFSSQPESSGAPSAIIANFGQRAWAYTPPAGFNAITTKNLPRLTVGSAAATPNQFFDAVLYTGTGAARSVSGFNFAPDLLWVKDRTSSSYHRLFDRVRGATNGPGIYSNDSGPEAADNLTFTSTGFSYTTDPYGTGMNVNGNLHVAWGWKAGGTAVANTAGTITSQVSANTASGFSIVTFTGTTSNVSVGHGLVVTPKVFIVKSRSSGNWWYYTTQIDGSLDYLALNTSDASGNASQSLPTSSVFYQNQSNASVAYCFAEVEGFSKFGSYVGNGSADGPFVYTGFRPAFILTKDITSSSYWWEMVDSARAPSNPSDKTLYANVSDSEYTSSGYDKDLLSNGFKIRGTSGGHNTSGSTYIYMAFAGKPFGNVNGVAR